MNAITVDFGALEQANADMMVTVKKLEQRLDQLETELNPLVANWTGQAAELYKTHQRQWHKAATDMHASLARLGTAVSDSHDAFTDVEQRNASLF